MAVSGRHNLKRSLPPGRAMGLLPALLMLLSSFSRPCDAVAVRLEDDLGAQDLTLKPSQDGTAVENKQGQEQQQQEQRPQTQMVQLETAEEWVRRYEEQAKAAGLEDVILQAAKQVRGKKVLFIGDSVIRQDFTALGCILARLEKGIEYDLSNERCDLCGFGEEQPKPNIFETRADSYETYPEEKPGECTQPGRITVNIGPTSLTYYWIANPHNHQALFNSDGQFSNGPSRGYTVDNVPSILKEQDIIYTTLLGTGDKATPEDGQRFYSGAFEGAVEGMMKNLESIKNAKAKHGLKAKIVLRSSQAEDFKCYRKHLDIGDKELWGGPEMDNSMLERFVAKEQEAAAGVPEFPFVNVFEATKKDAIHTKYGVCNGCSHIPVPEGRLHTLKLFLISAFS